MRAFSDNDVKSLTEREKSCAFGLLNKLFPERGFPTFLREGGNEAASTQTRGDQNVALVTVAARRRMHNNHKFCDDVGP